MLYNSNDTVNTSDIKLTLAFAITFNYIEYIVIRLWFYYILLTYKAH